MIARVPVPCVDSSLGMKLLPSVLSVTAGTVDAISFLGLGGLFTAHITGNLVILAARIATAKAMPIAPILAVPVFIAVLGVARLAAVGFEATRHGSMRPLLTLQFLLLAGFLATCRAAGPGISPAAPAGIVAGMLGVAAMAVQNVFVQVSLEGAPATSAMTTSITSFVMDVGTMLFSSDARELVQARSRAKHTWPAIIGFAAGCGLGAVCEAQFGLRSVVLPTGFALLALILAYPPMSNPYSRNPVMTRKTVCQ